MYATEPKGMYIPLSCLLRRSRLSKIFKAGGIQAIAAMAYGTESVPKVKDLWPG